MNGVVTKSELEGRARRIDVFDINGDAEVQLAEYLQSHKTMFTEFDADQSGSIDLSEFEKAQASARKG